MPSPLVALAALSLIAWLYLAALRGGFWRADQRLGRERPADGDAPPVLVLVPARDEAEVIGACVRALARQDYPGRLDVIVVDDHSADGTATVARAAAQEAGGAARVRIVAARALPPGWSGKLWALSEGLAHAHANLPAARFVWLCDADIEPAADTLARLVAKAEAQQRDLVSLMVALSCQGFWERLLVPPFVYFFQMLYPFRWVNDPARRSAAAAGGCVLLRRVALVEAGGFAAIRGALIDDCALARLVKRRPNAAAGGIWLGLARGEARSIRPYRGLGDIWRMVARSAYTQLDHAPLLLLGTLAGMAVTFLAPPVLGLTAPLHGDRDAALLGFAAWSLMAATALPTYRLYGQPPWSAAFLPLAALLYCAMTLDSALGHLRGRGGAWKGRIQAPAAEVERGPDPL